MTHKPLFKLYAASCVPDGGIYCYSMSDEGKLTLLSKVTLDRPMYFQKVDDTLHVILREVREFDKNSAYVSYNANEATPNISKAISTQGIVACHLCVSDGSVYTANYLSGSITKLGEKTVVHAHKENMIAGRQDAPHTHCVISSPDEKYLLCTDLGLDKIFVYDKSLNLISECSVPNGHGVRHIVFDKSERFLYSVNELASSVSVFEYIYGRLHYVSTYSCNVSTPNNTAAAIRLTSDSKRMYVSQRGEDCVSVFDVNENELSFIGNYPIFGGSPRDIFLTPDDRFLICANEKGSLTVISTESMSLCDTAELSGALCVYAEYL